MGKRQTERGRERERERTLNLRYSTGQIDT